jgi:hypothetical protein
MQRQPVFYLTRILITPVMLAIVPILCGCGKSEGKVKGKVSYNGTTLKGGNVVFQGEQTYSTTIDEDGNYTSPDMIVGAYKVSVDTSPLKPTLGNNKNKDKHAKLDPDTKVPAGYTPSGSEGYGSAKNAQRYVFVPPNYSDPDASGVTYTVTGGSQEFNIELK